MKHAALILTLALAGCMGVETDCRWDGVTGADCTEGNAGDGVSAPQAAPEPAKGAEPAKPARSAPAPRAAAVSRPAKPEPNRSQKVAEPEPQKPEPAKPEYSDWSQPGDDEIFEAALAEGYTEAEIRAKKADLAQARSDAEAAAKAQAGGFNR